MPKINQINEKIWEAFDINTLLMYLFKGWKYL